LTDLNHARGDGLENPDQSETALRVRKVVIHEPKKNR